MLSDNEWKGIFNKFTSQSIKDYIYITEKDSPSIKDIRKIRIAKSILNLRQDYD